MPNNPMVLLSFVNTQLRDVYDSLEDLSKSFGVKEEDIKIKLASIDYYYDEKLNKFI